MDQGSGVAVSCGVGQAGVTPIRPLVWELSYAMGAAAPQKKTKTKKNPDLSVAEAAN